MQAPAPASTAPTEITLTDRSLAACAALISPPPIGAMARNLRMNIPGKTSRDRHTVVQRMMLPPLFVAPVCLEEPERIGRLLQLWHAAFRAGDAVQLILPVQPGPDHIDRAIAAVQEAAAAGGVDLDALAEMVLTTVPGQSPADIAGVASARACWIALDGESAPAGSGFTPVGAEAGALRTAAQQLAPYAFAEPAAQSATEKADGAA
jgi:hypothetical protein